jgi:hypothetical protein
MKRTCGVMVTLALMLAAASVAEASCRVRGQFRLSSPGPWDLSLATDKNGCVNQPFWTRPTMLFRRLYIEEKPTQGALTLHEGGRFSYRPRPAFSGRDRFSLEICGEEFGSSGCAVLRFDVHVD